MQNKMKKYFLWSLLLIAYSCEYELKDVYYVDIDQNVDSPVSQIDLNFATDTVYLNSPSAIEFNIQASGHKFNWMKFYINNICYGTYYSNSGMFQVSPVYYNNYKNGVYLIKIEAFSNSTTGSIADAVGAEGFLFEYTWVMVIDDQMYLGSPFRNISRENRKLRLEWDLYKGTNFQYYEIQKSIDRNEWYSVCKIYDQLTLNTFDPSYIGEKAIYRINTMANGELYGGEADYQDTLPQLRLENLGDKSFKLSWKSYFTDNIAGYKISILNDKYAYDLIATLPASDSTYIFQNGKFGVESELLLTTIPKNAPSYFSDDLYQKWYYSTKCKGTIGNKSFINGFVYVPYGNRMIYRTNNTIFLYDYESRIKTDSVSCSNDFQIRSVSPDGNFILGYENNSSFFIYDVSARTWKNVDFAQITGSQDYYWLMDISNTGVAIVNAERGYYVYDFVNDTLLASRTDFDYLPLYLRISADGKYFYNGYNYLFQIEGNTIKQLPDINQGFYDFNPGNPEEVIVYTPNVSIQFMNIITRNISRSIPMSCEVLHNIDFNTERILGSTQNEFKVYDLKTGNLIWSYPTYSQTNFTSDQFQLCKDVIYWYEGYSINIE